MKKNGIWIRRKDGIGKSELRNGIDLKLEFQDEIRIQDLEILNRVQSWILNLGSEMGTWFEIWNEMELVLRIGIKVEFGFGFWMELDSRFGIQDGIWIWNLRSKVELDSGS